MRRLVFAPAYLGVFCESEQALHRQPIATIIIPGHEQLGRVAQDGPNGGVVTTFFPAGFKLPMVAPRDIAKFAAALLTTTTGRIGLHYIEGPERYSASDVAATFAHALGRTVTVETVSESQWMATLTALGFSERATESMAAMTRITLNGAELRNAPVRSTTTLREYIEALVYDSCP